MPGPFVPHCQLAPWHSNSVAAGSPQEKTVSGLGVLGGHRHQPPGAEAVPALPHSTYFFEPLNCARPPQSSGEVVASGGGDFLIVKEGRLQGLPVSSFAQSCFRAAGSKLF